MKKRLISMTLLAIFAVANHALATEDSEGTPDNVVAPAASLSKSIGRPTTTSHARQRLAPLINPSSVYQYPTPQTAQTNQPPLACTITQIGIDAHDSKTIIDLNAFTEPVVTPDAQITTLFNRINTTWESYAHSTYDMQTAFMDMGEAQPIRDPINAQVTRYFKAVFGNSKGDKPAWRRSKALNRDTQFKSLQIDISNIMNTLTAVSVSPEPISSPRRLFRSKSTKELKASGDIIHRPLSPNERLRTFLGLINRLNAAGHNVFSPDTIRNLNEHFGRSDLIITRVETLLITNGSDIPDFTQNALQPGDLGIIIETLSGPKNNMVKTRYLLRIN